MNMNKKGFLVRDFIIILVLFGVVNVLGYLIVLDMASSETGYNVTNMTDENFQKHYDILTEIKGNISEMGNATTSKEKMTVVSTFTTMFQATFSIISITFESFGIVDKILTGFADDFGVPSRVANVMFKILIPLILLTMLIFIIISSVSKGKM